MIDGHGIPKVRAPDARVIRDVRQTAPDTPPIRARPACAYSYQVKKVSWR
jgi:hypothetical protein